MQLIYFDESGLSRERFLVVAGIIIEADVQYMPVASYLKSLIAEFVPLEDQLNFSFHATKLFSGKKPYTSDKYSLQRRIEILKRVFEIPGLFQIPIVYGYVDKQASIPGSTPKQTRITNTVRINHSIAFSMCAVAAERFMKKYARNEEIATLHAERNDETYRMLRLARRSLAGRSRYNLALFLGKKAQQVLPITRIVDEIRFHEKDDALLLQLADACAFLLRHAFEGRQDCGVFFDAFTNKHPHVLEELCRVASVHPVGGNIINFVQQEVA